MPRQERSLAIKPIILVCGANYSGTSMVAKLLIDNGGWVGDLDTSFSPEVPYPRYEDKFFHSFCRRVLGIEKGEHNNKEIVDYLNSLPKDKVVILKYPKAVLLANALAGVTDRQIKMVFVVRNPRVNIVSAAEKNRTELPNELTYLGSIHDLGTKYTGEYYPAIFERLLAKREVKELLGFCELKPEKIVTSAIKPSMVNYGDAS